MDKSHSSYNAKLVHWLRHGWMHLQVLRVQQCHLRLCYLPFHRNVDAFAIASCHRSLGVMSLACQASCLAACSSHTRRNFDQIGYTGSALKSLADRSSGRDWSNCTQGGNTAAKCFHYGSFCCFKTSKRTRVAALQDLRFTVRSFCKKKLILWKYQRLSGLTKTGRIHLRTRLHDEPSLRMARRAWGEERTLRTGLASTIDGWKIKKASSPWDARKLILNIMLSHVWRLSIDN